MAYVTDKKVSLGSQYNYGEAVAEIATLVGVGTRSDGKYYLADVCQSDKVNEWSKWRPIPHSTWSNLTEQQRKDANWGFNINVTPHEHELEWSNMVISPKSMSGQISRIKDFNGYNHAAKFGLSFATSDGSSLNYTTVNKLQYVGTNAAADNISVNEVWHLIKPFLDNAYTSSDGNEAEAYEIGAMLYTDTGLVSEFFEGGEVNITDGSMASSVVTTLNNNILNGLGRNPSTWFRNNVPPWHNAYFATVFRARYLNPTGAQDFGQYSYFSFLLNPTPVVYRSFTYKTPIANYFSRRSWISTNENQAGSYIRQWEEQALEIRGHNGSNTNWDEIAFTCSFENPIDGEYDWSLTDIRLKMTVDSGPASVARKSFLHTVTFPNHSGSDIKKGEIIGQEKYFTGNVKNTDYTFYINTQQLYSYSAISSWWNNSAIPLKLQLVLALPGNFGMRKYRILTPEVKLMVKFNKSANTKNPPKFPYTEQRIEPETWTQES